MSKIFLFSYEYAGSQWGFDVLAEDREDAERKVRAMSDAWCDGELVGVIPASEEDENWARYKPELLN